MDSPLTYEREHRPTALRPAAYRPGTGVPSARSTWPVPWSTTRPPRVSTGAGYISRGRIEKSIIEYGGGSRGESRAAGFPAGSAAAPVSEGPVSEGPVSEGPALAATALYAATVAAS